MDDGVVHRILDSHCIEDRRYDLRSAISPFDVPLERKKPGEGVKGYQKECEEDAGLCKGRIGAVARPKLPSHCLLCLDSFSFDYFFLLCQWDYSLRLRAKMPRPASAPGISHQPSITGTCVAGLGAAPLYNVWISIVDRALL